MRQLSAIDHVNKLLTFIGILILLLYTYSSCAKYQAPGNGLLKKRVVERHVHSKMSTILDTLETKSIQEALERMQGINTLFAELKVDSVSEVIRQVRVMRKEVSSLLGALDVTDVKEGLKRAKQVKAVIEQLSSLQNKLAI
jgi:uncharacterized Ntn-hydrolase superfamily protein